VPSRRARAEPPPETGGRSGGGPARARLDVDERRKQLVALGLDLFGARSYDEVSIDELAAAAGISKGLLYHYFPTKKDFYVATVREAAQQLVDRTSQPREGEPIERLRAGLDAYLDYVVAHQQPYVALLRSGVGVDAEVARIVDATRAALSTRLLEGTPIDAKDPLVRLAVRGWIGFVEAATLDWLDGKRRVARGKLRDLLAQTLLRTLEGVATAPAPR
jgi:AcrR family transcriptional regulator